MLRSRRIAGFLVIALGGACANIWGIEDLPRWTPIDDDASPDARRNDVTILPGDRDTGVDAPDDERACDLEKPFGSPVLVPGLEPAGGNAWPWLSADETILYFASSRGGANYLLYTATRPDRFTPFSGITRAIVGTGFALEIEQTLSDDRLRMIFTSGPTGPGYDLYISSRADPNVPFDGSTRLPISSPAYDAFPFLTTDQTELWFGSARNDAGHHIYRSRASGATFGAADLVQELRSEADDNSPVLSADAKTIFFSSRRPDKDAVGDYDMWMARRDQADGRFGPATILAGLNTPKEDWPGWVSRDGCRLYYTNDRNIFMAERSR